MSDHFMGDCVEYLGRETLRYSNGKNDFTGRACEVSSMA